MNKKGEASGSKDMEVRVDDGTIGDDTGGKVSEAVNGKEEVSRPKIMDQATANMCEMGIGKTGFARVLVEVEAVKELKNIVKIEYVDKDKNVKGSKEVQVEFEWKPDRCSHCQVVFGHQFDKCKVRPKTDEEKKAEEERLKDKQGVQKDGFIDVQYKRGYKMQQKGNGQARNYRPQFQRQEYRKKENVNGKGKEKMYEEGSQGNDNLRSGGSSRNRYDALRNIVGEERNEESLMKDRMVVEEYLNKKIQPTSTELQSWTKDMEDYFKRQWEIDRSNKGVELGMHGEDVMEGVNEMAQTMANENVIGLSQSILN
ncbi:hypothetical protein CTI12_AA342270 [Artemisia annua]|uniref:Zinc knuckle CX2CX4HX4C n=1 Tax=Artemisia annua TaxID=35608 RepID=A0A2U1MT56_ARTAN|nr:hypothetical protein CTI12_AA342270 [Artemisia annua]